MSEEGWTVKVGNMVARVEAIPNVGTQLFVWGSGTDAEGRQTRPGTLAFSVSTKNHVGFTAHLTFDKESVRQLVDGMQVWLQEEDE